MTTESNTRIVAVENVVVQGNVADIQGSVKGNTVMRAVTVDSTDTEVESNEPSIVIQQGGEVTATEGAEPEIYIVIPSSEFLDGQPIVLSQENFVHGNIVQAGDTSVVSNVQTVLDKSPSAEQQPTSAEPKPPPLSGPHAKRVAVSGTKRNSAEAALNSIMRNTDIKTKQEVIIIQDKDADLKPSPSKKTKQIKIQGITCKICKELFDSEKDLHRHMDQHRKGQPFSCCVCNEGFTEVGTYHAHMKKHAVGQKMYTCEVCKVTMKNYSCFITHRRTHTGEKPYKCEICSAGFAHVMTLRSHMQVHASAKAKSPSKKST